MKQARIYIKLIKYCIPVLLLLITSCSNNKNDRLHRIIWYEESQNLQLRYLIKNNDFERLNKCCPQAIRDYAAIKDSGFKYFTKLDTLINQLIKKTNVSRSKIKNHNLFRSGNNILTPENSTSIYSQICLIRKKCDSLIVIIPYVDHTAFYKTMFSDSIYIKLKSDKISSYSNLQTLVFLKQLQNEVLFSEFKFCDMILNYVGGRNHSGFDPGFACIKTDKNYFRQNDTAIAWLLFSMSGEKYYKLIIGKDTILAYDIYELPLNTSKQGTRFVNGFFIKENEDSCKFKSFPFTINYLVK